MTDIQCISWPVIHPTLYFGWERKANHLKKKFWAQFEVILLKKNMSSTKKI